MYNGRKLLLRFLYSLSIAIGCGLAAINPSCAHAFPENFIVTLGQYTVFESGVSDQVPVSVKLKWPGHTDNTITIFYSAYSGGAQYWGTNTPIQLSDPGHPLWQNGAIVPAAGVPVTFYAEAQGSSGGDAMQATQLGNFTFRGGPLHFEPQVSGLEGYRVRVQVVSSQQHNNLQLFYNANNHENPPTHPFPSTNPFNLSPDEPWIGEVKVPDSHDRHPVTLDVSVHGGPALAVPYKLGTSVATADTDDGQSTLTVGPTFHRGKWTVNLKKNLDGMSTQVDRDPTHSGVHQHVKVFFSAQDQEGNGKGLTCEPTVVKDCIYDADNGKLTDHGHALSAVKISTQEAINGRVKVFAILALYDNNNGAAPASFIAEPATKLFGP